MALPPITMPTCIRWAEPDPLFPSARIDRLSEIFTNLDLKMLPGVNTKALKQMKADPKRMKHMEAIVLSMTKAERKKPDLMNGPRRARVAKGSGRPTSEVNRLLEQFREMQKMMKKMAGGGRMGMPSMPGMFGR